MPRLIHHAALLLACTLPSSCLDCDRGGCERLTQLVTSGETGVGGVVAVLSDVVSDGCQECPLGDATVELWRVDAAVTNEAAAAATVAARAADVTENASRQYSLALEPGQYLLCVRPNCIDLPINAGQTMTVNIERRDGPTNFFVGHPTAFALQEENGFEVGY